MNLGEYISPELMSMIMLVCKVVVAVLAAIFLASLFSRGTRDKVKKRYGEYKRSKYEKDMDDPEKKFAYDEIEAEMLAGGIKYRLGSNFSPFDYMVLRIVLSFITAFLCAFYKLWLMPIGFLCMYLLVPFYFKEQDGNDNEAMLPDICRMNSITALQLKNGVYLSKVVYECARVTEHPRLKQALRELAIDIDRFTSVEEAARRFKAKFNNQHIETYAKVLEQFQETGQSLEFFEDIAASVDRINESIAILEEKRADRVSSAFQLLLFLGPVLIVFYILVGSFSATGLW